MKAIATEASSRTKRVGISSLLVILVLLHGFNHVFINPEDHSKRYCLKLDGKLYVESNSNHNYSVKYRERLLYSAYGLLLWLQLIPVALSCCSH